MDPPTHGLLGAVIGQAFAPALGRKALLYGAALNMLPDVDVIVIPLLGGLAEWRYHRTVTHSLPVLAAVGLALGWWLARRAGVRRAMPWIAFAWLALMAHPLADAFTSYGTVLLWPSWRRYAWDAVPIVDLIFTGALLLALAVGWRWRRRPRAGLAASLGALAFVVGYDAYGLRLNRAAEEEARRQAALAGYRPSDVHAYPVLVLPWLRRVVVREAADVRVGWVSMWAPRPIEWHSVPVARGSMPAAASGLEAVQLFEWFSMGQTAAAVLTSAEGVRIEVDDLRYGFPHDPLHGIWGVRVQLDESGAPLGPVERIRRPPPPLGPAARWFARATFLGDTRFEGAGTDRTGGGTP
jgi:inner membrane protein